MVSGGGHDLITPGSEAWRIFEGASCERELVFYPRGAHDCFNVMADLRPRMVSWLSDQLARHRSAPRWTAGRAEMDGDPGWTAAEAVDPDFADALSGDITPRQWNRRDEGRPVKWGWPWSRVNGVEVVHRQAPAEFS